MTKVKKERTRNKNNKVFRIIAIVLLVMITIYFVYLFFNSIASIERDLSFCEDIEKDNYQVPSCKRCYNVTYDYSEICKDWEKYVKSK